MSWSPWAELRLNHPDVWVHRCRLSEGLGWWCPSERIILVDDRLGPVATRCVVAHEIAHATLGHEACHDYADSTWLAGRLESAADRWAAAMLVTLPALEDALTAYPDDLDSVCEHLHVTADVVRTRLDMVGKAYLSSPGAHGQSEEEVLP
ncbi:ImmA/IrrE family metallo-endopeptidase [Angustibacter sp. McL0619]|uniref:ImmA/IrrE family metallo-endopeptidase n=1 Tax=Angustibacter sp. McL0619 TaxID=3415676 RepID=UPI003CF21C34